MLSQFPINRFKRDIILDHLRCFMYKMHEAETSTNVRPTIWLRNNNKRRSYLCFSHPFQRFDLVVRQFDDQYKYLNYTYFYHIFTTKYRLFACRIQPSCPRLYQPNLYHTLLQHG